jgi:site-specific recombinase XerD
MAKPLVPAQWRSMPFLQWPTVDQHEWLKALEAGDVFGTAGGGAHWGAVTRRSNQAAYGRWLSFLTFNGSLSCQEVPAERITRERTGAYVEALQARGLAIMSVWSYLSTLRNIAYAFAPEEDWSWLNEIVNRLHRLIIPADLTPLLRPVDELFDASIRLMQMSESMVPHRQFQNHVWYRNGLMLCFLTVTLLRLKNLADLRLGAHLIRQPDGYLVVVPGLEVKNRQPIEIPLPDVLAMHIDRYLKDHRDALLQGKTSDALWITQYGEAMTASGVARQIKKTCKRMVDSPLSCHRVRHSAATTIATVAPEHARIIRPLLAHTTSTTSEKYYNKAKMTDAGRRYTASLEVLRETIALEQD